MSQFDTDAEHKAKVEAYFAKIFAPLTPEEQVFFNGQQWLVFDAETISDIAFDTQAEAIAWATGPAEYLAVVNPQYDPAKRAQARRDLRTA